MEPGDLVFISKNNSLSTQESDITADQIPLQEIDAPFSTFIVKRISGVWKVDASFIIESFKANLFEASAAKKLDEPEEAIVKFMLAVMKGDKEGIENTIIPNPDSSILAEGQHAPENTIPILEAELRLAPYERLQPGDSFQIGNGKTHVVQASEINENRLLINQGGSPLPFVLVRLNGVWKVDSKPIIAGRKAAEAQKRLKNTRDREAFRRGAMGMVVMSNACHSYKGIEA